MMIGAMLDNLSEKMRETKKRSNVSYIRQLMDLYEQLQRALNIPMLMLVTMG